MGPEVRSAAIYLITFCTYGSHLHGEEATVDRHRNAPGSPVLPADPAWLRRNQQRMTGPTYELDRLRRRAALAGFVEVCDRRGWELLAAHVRTNHVHVVVGADRPAEQVMIALKANASRRLNRIDGERRRWTKHGSTRYLWGPEQVRHAVTYVLDKQGEPMEVYCGATRHL
jgi:REP element-mobilizing transposase RayT